MGLGIFLGLQGFALWGWYLPSSPGAKKSQKKIIFFVTIFFLRGCFSINAKAILFNKQTPFYFFIRLPYSSSRQSFFCGGENHLVVKKSPGGGQITWGRACRSGGWRAS